MLITYCFEYAESDKSKCAECNKAIKRNALRIGELSRFSKKVKKSMATYRWWHFDCFKMVEKILEITPEKIRGYDKLSDVDKQRIVQLANLGVDATWNDVPDEIRIELDKNASKKDNSKTKSKPKAELNKKTPQQRKANTKTNKSTNTKAKDNTSDEKDVNTKAKPTKTKIIKKAKTGLSVGGLSENKINDAIRQLSKKLGSTQNSKKNNIKKSKTTTNAAAKNNKTKAKNQKVSNKNNKNTATSKSDDILNKLKKKIQSKNTKITKKKN
ncbi:hypothetical protein BCR32DRAFT_293252 [Anaeromyces robustus]|uniref:PARP-type domain-containing protein n=1 Tax=Anaeromyces robustus TaxID=1754192 RepID=A0A1Y1VR66_9FUNG|nr:hypothetical protein BCR32DRAFT_298502 [Anaeromyces robustus]ORX81510.1 hypothetical protein BCR32DRAFT_293252 [Anaeromyces robustus]|eukprot:ORX63234.1 hypothetical protein BCR32DRAFT_298502 [Anaeromyces robustus]